jgi:hypothetical protein
VKSLPQQKSSPLVLRFKSAKKKRRDCLSRL